MGKAEPDRQDRAMGRPLERRVDARLQVGALCWQRRGKGHRLLLITSRDTGRWVLPKGWPMRNRTEAEAAAREAFEEAGVVGHLVPRMIGFYSYLKRLDRRRAVPCIVRLYPIEVERLLEDFPERGQRRQAWMKPKEAARAVQEADLARLLRRFDPEQLLAAAPATAGA